jgi:hypothetical protein
MSLLFIGGGRGSVPNTLFKEIISPLFVVMLLVSGGLGVSGALEFLVPSGDFWSLPWAFGAALWRILVPLKASSGARAGGFVFERFDSNGLGTGCGGGGDPNTQSTDFIRSQSWLCVAWVRQRPRRCPKYALSGNYAHFWKSSAHSPGLLLHVILKLQNHTEGTSMLQ